MALMRKLVALAVILLIVMGLYPLIVTKATHPSQLSAYDEDDDDLSLLREKLEAQGYSTKALLSSPQMLSQLTDDERNNSIMFIAGIENRYTEFDRKNLNSFIAGGGSAVLADDFGYGNTAITGLESVGVSFYNKPLYDLRNWQRGENASTVHLYADPETFGSSGYELYWSQATALIIGESEDLKVHAYSSQSSFVDKDGDGVGGPDEVANRTKGGIPTIAEVGLGKNGGKLIILADPSMFINDLLELNGNLQFTLDMVEYLAKGTPKETTIIFEESRHLQPTLFTSIYVELFGWLAYGTGSMIVKIITLSALILGLEFVLMRIANPTLYRHVFNPSWGRTSRWRIPHTHYLHPDTVRETLLERIRIMHGLPREDFKVLPPMELEGMVREPALVGFLLNKDNKIPLEDVLQAMDRLSK